MMKNSWKISLLSIFLSQSCAVNAQNEEPIQMLRAKWGQEYKEPSNSNLSKIIATDGDGFYTLRMHRDGLLGNLVRRDGQMWRHCWRVNAAGDGNGNDNFIRHFELAFH